MSATNGWILGCVFVGLVSSAAGLQLWLRPLPLEPVPTVRDLNGRTTAPGFWRHRHRFLGYAFILICGILLTSMLPRLPDVLSGDAAATSHSVLGLAFAPVLIWEVALRCFLRFGKSLSWLGAALAFRSLIAVGLATPTLIQLSQLPVQGPGEVRA